MVIEHISGDLLHVRGGAEDPVADLRVALELGPFALVELPALVDDRVADGDLADVVHEAEDLQVVELLLGERHRAADLPAQAAHAVGVVPFPGIVFLERREYGVDRLAAAAVAGDDLLAVHVVLGLFYDLVEFFVGLRLRFVSQRDGIDQRVDLDLGHGLVDPVADEPGFLLSGHRQKHDELVAAPPGDDVLLAADGRESLRHGNQEGVARPVAEGVVRKLQAVQVAYNDGKGLEFGRIESDERLVEIPPVVKARQLVVVAYVLALVFNEFALGNVRDDRGKLQGLRPVRHDLEGFFQFLRAHFIDERIARRHDAVQFIQPARVLLRKDLQRGPQALRSDHAF